MGDLIPAVVRLDIYERDQWRCVRCGALVKDGNRSIQHLVRGNRSHVVKSNLITMCMEPIADMLGCHRWATDHPREARMDGGWVRLRNQVMDPALSPVLYNQPGRYGWYRLHDDGDMELTEIPAMPQDEFNRLLREAA